MLMKIIHHNNFKKSINMKFSLKIVYSIVVIFSILSCEKGEIFTGSPVNTSVQFESIVGTVTVNESTVVSGQRIPVTVTLPKAFDIDVNIQASTFVPSTNKRVATSFIMPAGQTTLDTFVSSPLADNSTLNYIVEAQVFLTALGTSPINPKVGFVGKQYTLTSNIAKVDFGDTALPGTNSNKCSIRFDYELPRYNVGLSIYNDLNLVLKKTNGTVIQTISALPTAPINGTVASAQPSRYENIIFLSTAPDDTYTISIYANQLISSPTNLKYRFAVRFPDESAKTYTGVLNNLTVTPSSNAVAKLKVVKSPPTVAGGLPNYEITQI
jgi:hypothetical protein